MTLIFNLLKQIICLLILNMQYIPAQRECVIANMVQKFNPLLFEVFLHSWRTKCLVTVQVGEGVVDFLGSVGERFWSCCLLFQALWATMNKTLCL